MRSVVIVAGHEPKGNPLELAQQALIDQPQLDLLMITASNELPPAYRSSSRIHAIYCNEHKRPTDATIAACMFAIARNYPRILRLRSDNLIKPADHVQTKPPLLTHAANTQGGSIKHWACYQQLVSQASKAYARTVLQIPVDDLRYTWRWLADAISTRLQIDMRDQAVQIELWAATHTPTSHRHVPIVWTQRAHVSKCLSGRIVANTLSINWRLQPIRATSSMPTGAA